MGNLRKTVKNAAHIGKSRKFGYSYPVDGILYYHLLIQTHLAEDNAVALAVGMGLGEVVGVEESVEEEFGVVGVVVVGSQWEEERG